MDFALRAAAFLLFSMRREWLLPIFIGGRFGSSAAPGAFGKQTLAENSVRDGCLGPHAAMTGRPRICSQEDNGKPLNELRFFGRLNIDQKTRHLSSEERLPRRGYYAPERTLAGCSDRDGLFDYSIRSDQNRLWNLEPERLGSLQVNDQFEFGSLFNGHCRWSRSF
jgi:hypothetical protein